jgi:GDP/UDP-N,N'-diacetylbacillosamine 2-epimerase (hydrolysing)
MSVAIKKFYEAFGELKPDVLVVLGDRYEIMAAAIAAMLSKLPIAHISGGASTFGIIDEEIRHCITKMSHIHFTICEEYRNRVIQLGENPEYVFNVGSLGVENIKNTKLLAKDELEERLNFKFGPKNLLVTFHPMTLAHGYSQAEQFQTLLDALSELKNTKIIFTKPNSDDGNEEIFDSIDEYVSLYENAIAFESLGQLRYFSILQFADAVVGNSSSGITEAPSFKIGTINIGDRQQGRIQSGSVINCDNTKEAIFRAIQKLYSTEFQQMLKTVRNFYEGNDTANSIIKKLKEIDASKLLKKTFFDLPMQRRFSY